MSKLLGVLRSRGFVNAITNESQLARKLETPQTCYIGFDPTADSLHIGNLLQLICLKHFQNAGHRTIALIGGATAMIGDPSGRSTERPLLTTEQIKNNTAGLAKSLSTVLHLDTSRSVLKDSENLFYKKEKELAEGEATLLLNNYDWFKDISVLQFLRDVGKHFKIQQMLNKHVIKSRMSTDGEEGISYTEFSYQLLQAYDFYHLYKNENCILQIGGSDQWGNITAGTQYIHKQVSGNEEDDSLAFGMTLPLITTADGKKIGKSTASGGAAIWLDSDRSKPFNFYQYFINLTDADAKNFLPLFTFLPLEEISTIQKQHDENPHLRIAQKVLAERVTELIHGPEQAQQAKQITATLFDSNAELTLASLPPDAPKKQVAFAEVTGMKIIDLVMLSNFVGTRKTEEAKRLIADKGLQLNNEMVTDANYQLQESDVKTDDAKNTFMVLKKGKKNFFIVEVQKN